MCMCIYKQLAYDWNMQRYKQEIAADFLYSFDSTEEEEKINIDWLARLSRLSLFFSLSIRFMYTNRVKVTGIVFIIVVVVVITILFCVL